MASSDLVTFRDGFVASTSTVARLLDIEARGAKFRLLDNDRFRVEPHTVLTPEDVRYLQAHRDEARQVIAYSERMCQVPS